MQNVQMLYVPVVPLCAIEDTDCPSISSLGLVCRVQPWTERTKQRLSEIMFMILSQSRVEFQLLGSDSCWNILVEDLTHLAAELFRGSPAKALYIATYIVSLVSQ